MTRLRRIEDYDRIFFVTTNLARHVIPLGCDERTMVLDQVRHQHAAGDFALFAFVVMTDHLHLLLAPRSKGLIAIMREMKSRTGQQLLHSRQSRTRIWQPRYFDFILRRARNFWNKMEYIHQNPVKAGLVVRPEDWVWSSAHCKDSHARPIVDLIDIPAEPNAWLYPAPWRR